MSNPRYTEEFKIEAVKQAADRGHSVAEVAARLRVSGHSLYLWIKRYSKPTGQRQHEPHRVSWRPQIIGTLILYSPAI